MNVVEANSLGKRYGSTWALRECSLAIPAGHVVGLVGPNGAGKSTLLNLAAGLAVPEEEVWAVAASGRASDKAAARRIFFMWASLGKAEVYGGRVQDPASALANQARASGGRARPVAWARSSTCQ